MNQYNVWYRVRCDYVVEKVVQAKSEKSAIKLAEKEICNHLNIDRYEILDEEVYCEKLNK